MLDRVTDGTRDRVSGLVASLLAEGGKTAPVATEDRLVDAGLTSMDMVNLMLAVEAEFDLMIPPQEITPANFRSIATISALVEQIRDNEA